MDAISDDNVASDAWDNEMMPFLARERHRLASEDPVQGQIDEWIDSGGRIAAEGEDLATSFGQALSSLLDSAEVSGVDAMTETASEIAALLVHGSGSLIEPGVPEDIGEISWREIVSLADDRDCALEPELSGELQRVLAEKISPSSDEMALRARALARVALGTKPNIAVTRFLGRLSRCYIAGFDPECVILCRSVLENAVAEAFDRWEVPVPATPEGRSSMASRLKFARRAGWLTQEGEARAWTVWQRGNKAVHDDPLATRDVLRTIEDTLSVVSELYISRNR